MAQVKGMAELIRYTSDPEGTIAAAAKLCYSSLEVDQLLQKVDESDNTKFIGMLIDIGHLSPFEHASFTFAIKGVSRALLAQITRHRVASFSVKSQRYISQSDFNYIIPPAISSLGKEFEDKYKHQMEQMAEWYQEWQLALGGKGESANEDARFVLPNACETSMLLTMNARELMHFFSLRCCNRAQWEIREIAWQMLQEVLKVAPTIFKNAGPDCVDKNCPEGKKTCGKAKEVKEKHQTILTSIRANLDKIRDLI